MHYCQDGMYIYDETEEIQPYYSYAENIGGHYKYSKKVNGRPYFTNEEYGIWWSNGYWLIGTNEIIGQTDGHAYYWADVHCPSQLYMIDWMLIEKDGWILYRSIQFITKCKYILITAYLLTS